MGRIITYYGGKQKLAPVIIEQIAAIPHLAYAEPYAGSLAVMFKKPIPTGVGLGNYKEAVNDHSENLIRMYRVARDNPQEFERLVRMTPYSQSEWKRSCTMLKNPDGYTEMQLALAYYVCINQSFSGKLGHGWSRTSGMYHHPRVYNNRKDAIPAALARLANAYIDCSPALDFIKSWDSPQTLFYIDPPYPDAHQGHYGGFTTQDWEQLCDLLDNSQCSYILSNYDQERQPSGAVKIVVDAVSTARRYQKSESGGAATIVNPGRQEVLWVRDRSGNVTHPGILKAFEGYRKFFGKEEKPLDIQIALC
jgi:DNA adenine methylase